MLGWTVNWSGLAILSQLLLQTSRLNVEITIMKSCSMAREDKILDFDDHQAFVTNWFRGWFSSSAAC